VIYLCRVNKAEVHGPEVFLRLRLQERRLLLTCRSYITEAMGHEFAFERALAGSVRRLDLVLHAASWAPGPAPRPAPGPARPGLEQPEPGSPRTVIRGVVARTLGNEARIDCGPAAAGALLLDAKFPPGAAPSPGLTVVAEGELCAWPSDSGLLGEAWGRPSLNLGSESGLVAVGVKPAAALTDEDFEQLKLLLSRAFTDGPHLYAYPWFERVGETAIRTVHALDPAARVPLPPDSLAASPSVRQLWGHRCLGWEPVGIHVMLRAAGWLMAQATLIPRRMRLGDAASTPIELPVPAGIPGRELVVASVEDVATDPEARGLGYGRLVLRSLVDEAARRGHSLAVLATDSPRYHAGLGWRPWTGPVFFSAGERLGPQPLGEVMAIALDRMTEVELDSLRAGPLNIGDGPF
jgi:GNAT superfamily N-acetyltransferase